MKLLDRLHLRDMSDRFVEARIWWAPEHGQWMVLLIDRDGQAYSVSRMRTNKLKRFGTPNAALREVAYIGLEHATVRLGEDEFDKLRRHEKYVA
jgi:hypothetical protein